MKLSDLGMTTTQAAKGAQRLGALLTSAMQPQYVTRALVEQEKALARGYQLGLTDEQTREIIAAWDRHYRGTPWPLDWDEVRRAQVNRVRGGAWRPPPGDTPPAQPGS